MLKIIIPVLWSGLVVWSIWAFWRPSDDVREGTYRAEARFWCLFVTVGSALVLPFAVPLLGVPYGLAAVFWAIIAFPITLCAGYWASRVFHSIIDETRKK